MDNRKIYSLNLAAYIYKSGMEYTVHKDLEKEGLKYFSFNTDVTEVIEEYKQNRELQDFIRCYKKIKDDIHN
ncbi:DUF5659 domain-containing protein [Tissierella sp.]|uniref:DUF5659 domain-containing protein n=1 Tax=Tissierella sp. TaxID=41274 RepID=UPI003069CDC0